MEFRSKKDGTHFPLGGRSPDASVFRGVASQDKSRVRVTKSTAVDHDAVREAELFAVNDSQLYHSTHWPWVKNIQRKIQKKTFDMEKLVPAIEKYYVPRVQQSYSKQFGSLNMDKPTKQALARRLAEVIVSDAKDNIQNNIKT